MHTPLVGPLKQYGSLAEGQVGLSTTTYPQFNLIPYPQINFGYAKPGQLFVAKRNWWAFEMDLAGQDRAVTKITAPRRKFVVSIYEILRNWRFPLLPLFRSDGMPPARNGRM